jgi:hypothetical protein
MSAFRPCWIRMQAAQKGKVTACRWPGAGQGGQVSCRGVGLRVVVPARPGPQFTWTGMDQVLAVY